MQREGAKFNAELTRVLTRATAFEAVMRVRATRGVRITNFYGNYFIRGTDLLALPNCTPDSVFAVEFGYDEQLLTASVISVQVRRGCVWCIVCLLYLLCVCCWCLKSMYVAVSFFVC